MAARQEQLREQNHTMLVQLTDGLGNLGKSFESFAKQQQDENRVIHKRIDETDERMNKGIGEIKDSLAKKGQVSSGFIFSLVAIVISLATLLGGVVAAYVNVRLGNITPIIEAASARITAAEEQRQKLADQLHTVEINAERNSAAHDRDLHWLEKHPAP